MLAQSPSTVADVRTSRRSSRPTPTEAEAVPAAALAAARHRRMARASSGSASSSSARSSSRSSSTRTRPTTRSPATRARASSRSASHLLGGDRNGHDMLLSLAQGRPQLAARRARRGRASGSLVGGVLGLIAGYYRRRHRHACSRRVFNILLAIPQFVLALVARHRCSPRPRSTRPATSIRRRRSHGCSCSILALGIVSIPMLGRITRANALAVVAARVRDGGAGAGRDQPARHVPRGAAQRAAGDVLDRAARRSRS